MLNAFKAKLAPEPESFLIRKQLVATHRISFCNSIHLHPFRLITRGFLSRDKAHLLTYPTPAFTFASVATRKLSCNK